METRLFKEHDISLLGFGCMRLPLRNQEDYKSIDTEQVQQMVDYAYARGVNYYDTAYMYHEGMSESCIGAALKKYPRDSFFLADKMPGWIAKDLAGTKRIFAEQLERCGVEYFDFYLCHAIGKTPADFEEHFLQTGAFDYLLSLKDAGTIKNLGFSFHGNVPRFKELLERHSWDFVQIQLNYLDWKLQDAETLYRLLEEKNIPCIVMEPVRGGTLCRMHKEAERLLLQAAPGKSLASWAIRFVASLPNVAVVLSGMTVMEHVADNIQTMTDFTPLRPSDRDLLAYVADTFIHSGQIPCTACRYCSDCPSGVEIPEIFAAYNTAAAALSLPVDLPIQRIYNKDTHIFFKEYSRIAQEHRAHNCIACGQCVENCPQSIIIPAELQKIASLVRDLKPELGGK